jgi:hypothetical protein
VIIDQITGMADTSAVSSPAFFAATYFSWIDEKDQAFYWLKKPAETGLWRCPG